MADKRSDELRTYPRVEFLALKPEIEALQEKGYSTMGIFRKLKAEKDIYMSYASLTRFVRGEIHLPSRRSSPLKPQDASMQVKSATKSKANIPETELGKQTSSFDWNNIPDESDMPTKK